MADTNRTPAELNARLSDCREQVAHLLSELATDDLEPAERNWFERDVADLLAEIDALQARLVELASLVFEADGLTTSAAESSLSKSERAKALRIVREARRLFRDGIGRRNTDEARQLAIRVRDCVCVGGEPVALEMELLGRIMLSLLESSESTRLAVALENLTVSGNVSIEAHVARVAAAGFRAGIRAYSPAQRIALDALVTRGVVSLTGEARDEHRNEMVRLNHRGLLPRIAA